MSARDGKRRGRSRQSSTRDCCQLDSRNLLYWRRQHTVRELLALHRSGGDRRATTASGVALPDMEMERMQMPCASSLVAVASLCTSSWSSSLPLSPLSSPVNGSVGDCRASEVRRSVVDFVRESRSVDDVAETESSIDASDASGILHVVVAVVR
jgi:hypothetical protein